MNQCPNIDSLATLCAALDWNADNQLRHLVSCEHCLEQLRLLEATHRSFAISEEVGDDVVAKITHLISAEAAHEKARSQRAQKLGFGIEALLAGLTAVTIANGGGVGLSESVSATIFALAGSSVLAYRVFASSQSSASRSSGPSIQ